MTNRAARRQLYLRRCKNVSRNEHVRRKLVYTLAIINCVLKKFLNSMITPRQHPFYIRFAVSRAIEEKLIVSKF